MRKGSYVVLFLLPLVLGIRLTSLAADISKKPAGPSDILIVSGTITNAQGKALKDVTLTYFVNGRKVDLGETISTSDHGTYEAKLVLPAGTLPDGKVDFKAEKPSYKSSGIIRLEKLLKEHVDERGNVTYIAHATLTLERTTSPGFWIATLILLSVYGLIGFDVMHRTLAALFGAASMLFITYTAGAFDPSYTIISFEDAVHAIDMNVIFLLMAMMIIVGVLKRTGVFQWMAYKAFQMANGSVFWLAAALTFLTAFISAFLDNVTTMLLVFPVTFEICMALKVNPIAVLVPAAFASNVGGTATLIGDPPNMMIGSYANLTFIDFVFNLTLVCFAALVVEIIYFQFYYKKVYLKTETEDIQKMISHLREEYKITDEKLLVQALIILAITIFLFVVHGALNMEPSIAAMAGAAALLLVSRVKIVEILEKELEWPTLIFFIMLFIVVAGAEQTGLIQIIADFVKAMSGGSLLAALLMVLWVSAFLSAIIDNIPFTATMLPIVAYLNTTIPGAESGVLWWALSLGACLGGNGTMIGASANVVTVGMLEKAGYPVSFMDYFKIAFIPMIITIIICMLYLMIFRM